MAAIGRKYKAEVVQIRAKAEQNKIAAQLMDSASVSDKLREMGVSFTEARLNSILSKQKAVTDVLT